MASFEGQTQGVMEEIVKIESVAPYNAMRGVPTRHPLVTVTDLSEAQPMAAKTLNFGLYVIYLKELNAGS